MKGIGIMLNFGVIGYGYWGPNIVRNLTALAETNVTMVCDRDARLAEKAKQQYPHVTVTGNAEDIFTSSGIDAVAVVTPVSTHYDLARLALESGKHVFVEKPFTADSAQAEELIALARDKGLTIMVDHTFIFTGAVQKIKELIDDGTLGRLYYYDTTRVSLGLFQSDVNVIWDLACHDLAIIDHVIANCPEQLTVQGADHFERGQANLAYITIHYEGNLIIHINANWLSPMKVRSTLIGGEKKMLVWDDLKVDEKIRVYDKGVSVDNREGVYRMMVDYRSGDMWSPKVNHTEALKQELIYFAECVTQKKSPVNDGHSGLRVVKLLEAADQSLKAGGSRVCLK